MPLPSVVEGLAEFFAIFSDGTRVKMIIALALGDMCVTELTEALGLNQSTVSHQLRILKDAKIVKAERRGKLIVYSLFNKSVEEIMNLGARNI